LSKPFHVRCYLSDDHTFQSHEFPDADAFESAIRADGWTHTRNGWACPKCSEPAPAEMTIPLIGDRVFVCAFPHDMQPDEWRRVIAVMGAMRDDN
jgi:hypothetical protein